MATSASLENTKISKIKKVASRSRHCAHNISININVKKATLLLESQYSKNGYYQVNRCMNLSISLHVFREITVLIINNTMGNWLCQRLLTGMVAKQPPKPTQQFFKNENSLATFTSWARNTGICLPNFWLAFQCSTSSFWWVHDGRVIAVQPSTCQ